MVYVGVGVLIASLSFLIYRNRPASWLSPLGSWRRKSALVAADVIVDVDGKSQPRSDGSSDREEGEISTNAQNGYFMPSLLLIQSTTDLTAETVPSNSQQLSATPSISLNDISPLPTDILPVNPTQSTLNVSSQPSDTRASTRQKSLQPTSTSMPPPPRPPPKPSSRRAPPSSSSPTSALRVPIPSAASSLRVPPSKRVSNNSPALTASTQPPNARKSKKVILSPGHSPLDWALLTKSPSSSSTLRGANLPSHLIRVPPSLLKRMNGRKGRDAWSVWQGKVYNITPYLPFHPGGDGELMRAAGREAGTLFNEVHPWVNWEGMLGECLVGVLVDEGEDAMEKGGGKLDEID